MPKSHLLIKQGASVGRYKQGIGNHTGHNSSLSKGSRLLLRRPTSVSQNKNVVLNVVLRLPQQQGDSLSRSVDRSGNALLSIGSRFNHNQQLQGVHEVTRHTDVCSACAAAAAAMGCHGPPAQRGPPVGLIRSSTKQHCGQV
jgi:hypothetical protein